MNVTAELKYQSKTNKYISKVIKGKHRFVIFCSAFHDVPFWIYGTQSKSYMMIRVYLSVYFILFYLYIFGWRMKSRCTMFHNDLGTLNDWMEWIKTASMRITHIAQVINSFEFFKHNPPPPPTHTHPVWCNSKHIPSFSCLNEWRSLCVFKSFAIH